MAKYAGVVAEMYPTDNGCWYCGQPLESGQSWEIMPEGAWHMDCKEAARIWQWSVNEHRRVCHLEGCTKEMAYPFARSEASE